MYPEAFPFSLKAQARKEQLFVPAGWDSARVVASLVSPNVCIYVLAGVHTSMFE